MDEELREVKPGKGRQYLLANYATSWGETYTDRGGLATAHRHRRKRAEGSRIDGKI
jgi:hypothetical protein